MYKNKQTKKKLSAAPYPDYILADNAKNVYIYI